MQTVKGQLALVFMRKYLLYIGLTVVFLSCSEYQKALKSEDVDFRNQVFNKKYDKKKYQKAVRLFEMYATAMRPKPEAKDAFFKYSKALYNTKQYYSAGYQFESYVANYPKSEFAEEAAFLGAECYTKLSPVYSLDQVDTHKALDKLQVFVNKYPNSTYVTQANELVKKLNEKLELKAFEIAKQYNQISEHKAALKALDNFILDYPGTKFKEDALYYMFDSSYQIAIASVPDKKQERLNQAKKNYNNLVNYNASSKFINRANKLLETVEKELKQYNL